MPPGIVCSYIKTAQRFARVAPMVAIDTAFEAVIEGCAAPGAGRTETWINGPIQQLCVELHSLGVAHSVEAWLGGRLVGGSAPYYHDGRYATLDDLLRGADGAMGHTAQLSDADRGALVAYLKSL